MVYVQNRTASELQRSLHQVITESRALMYRRDFPINRDELIQATAKEGEKTAFKLSRLLEIQKILENLKNLRNCELEKHWQAQYDLMLAQTVAFQVTAFEYGALMAQLVLKPRKPSE